MCKIFRLSPGFAVKLCSITIMMLIATQGKSTFIFHSAMKNIVSKVVKAAEEEKSFFTPLNLEAPNTAAQAILGLKGSEAKTPASTQQLVAGLIQGIDEGGKLKSGLTVAIGMHALGGNSTFNIEQYRKSSFWRTYKSQFSFATTKGLEDDTLQLAAGLSIPIIDDTDWWKDKKSVDDLTKKVLSLGEKLPNVQKFKLSDYPEASATLSVENRMNQTRINLNGLISELDGTAGEKPVDMRTLQITNDLNIAPRDVPLIREYALTIIKLSGEHVKLIEDRLKVLPLPTMEEWNDEKGDWRKSFEKIATLATAAESIANTAAPLDFEKVTKEFGEARDKEFWNRKKLVVSFGIRGYSGDGSFDSVTSAGHYAWASYSQPFAKTGRTTLFGRYVKGERFTEAFPTGSVAADGYAVGIRQRWGDLATGYSLEYLYEDTKGGSTKSIERTYQFIFESKVNAKQWLVVGIGSTDLNGDRSFALFNINFAFDLTEKPQITTAKKAS